MKKTLLTYAVAIVACYSLTAQTTWSAKQTINGSTGANPYVIASGDLDGDNDMDIAIGTYASTLEWYKNDGTGTFTQQSNVTNSFTGPAGLVIVDMDGDGDNDILATEYSDSALVWFANDGSGNFGSETVISSSVSGAGAAVVGDINGDNNQDIVVIGYDSGITYWFSGDGMGNYTAQPNILNLPGSQPADIYLKDFDGDSDLDLVIASGGNEDNVKLLLNNGSGTFTQDTNLVTTGKTRPWDVSIADVDDDNNQDIVFADIDAGALWYKKETDGTYTESTLPGVANAANTFVDDFDNDSNNDAVIVSAFPSQEIAWLESDDMGGFNTAIEIAGSQGQAFASTINDFDGDGDLDIASMDYNAGTLYWFENLLETLSLDQVQVNSFGIYPNPATNAVYISTKNNEILDVSVFDILGKQVLKTIVANGQALNISSLKSGIYMLRLNNQNKTFKLVKE